jgi:PAS domain S-box-containing protein
LIGLLSDTEGQDDALVDVLRKTRIELHTARSVEDLRAACQGGSTDLLVLDINLTDPWPLVAQLKADPVFGGAPVLAWRHSPSPQDKRAAREVGADSYDGRPLNAERLQAKVEALLRSRHAGPLQALSLGGPAPAAPPKKVKKAPEYLILVVDDEQSVLDQLTERLNEAGYGVLCASDGATALALLKQEPVSLVLLDHSMPRMSGLEVLWRVRETSSSLQLPVLIMSSKTSAQDLLAALELGANDTLTKPLDLPVVLARLQLHLRLLKTSQELRRGEERFRLLTENSTDVVTRESSDGTWLYVSPASRRLLGYEPEELVGRSAWSLLHPEDFDALAHSYDTLMSSPDHFSLRYRIKHKEDRWVWVETSLHAIRDPATGEVQELQGAMRDVTAQVERAQRQAEDMLVRFGRIAEFRSGETRGHIQRLSAAAGILARRAGLSGRQAEHVRLASTLHDLGNIMIPMSVLQKPGPLTEEERAIVQQSPEHGYELLKDSGDEILEMAAAICWHHHEHWDGTGYPRGRRGKGIPVEARIVTICDSFDMMTSDRPYSRALPPELALSEMIRGRGKRFDPELLDLFLADIGELLALRGRFPDLPTSGSVVAHDGFHEPERVDEDDAIQ